VIVVEGMQFDAGTYGELRHNTDDLKVVFEKCLSSATRTRFESVTKIVRCSEGDDGKKPGSSSPMKCPRARRALTIAINSCGARCRLRRLRYPGYGDRRKAMLEEIAALNGRRDH